MPSGGRPYTKRQKLDSEESKTEKEFSENRHKMQRAQKKAADLDAGAAVEYYTRLFKDNDLMDKKNKARKASKEGPHGISEKSTYSGKSLKSSASEHKDDWKVTGQVTPGVWRTR